jgi:hypothetical protein
LIRAYALNILSKDVWNAHQRARRLLLDGARLRPICVGYTRSKLLFTTISNASIKAIATRPGKFSGRSMPARLTYTSSKGKQLIQQMWPGARWLDC